MDFITLYIYSEFNFNNLSGDILLHSGWKVNSFDTYHKNQKKPITDNKLFLLTYDTTVYH